MRVLVLTAAVVAAAGAAEAGGSHRVKGYVKSDGTYVSPTRATNPNSTKLDNYSSKPNINPSTGKRGTRDPFKPTTTRRRPR